MGEPPSNRPLKLYSNWESSCAYRVRIALNLKGLDYEYIPVNLAKGEQFSPEFRKLNPIGYVPVLVDEDVVISDSFAILLYLDEKYHQRPLLPTDIRKRAINYQAANIVSSSIQPFQNFAIQKYIEEKFGPDEKLPWVQCHIGKGFESIEKLLKDYAGRYATGDDVFLADLFLAPQIFIAKSFNVDMTVSIICNLEHLYTIRMSMVSDVLHRFRISMEQLFGSPKNLSHPVVFGISSLFCPGWMRLTVSYQHSKMLCQKSSPMLLPQAQVKQMG